MVLLFFQLFIRTRFVQQTRALCLKFSKIPNEVVFTKSFKILCLQVATHNQTYSKELHSEPDKSIFLTVVKIMFETESELSKKIEDLINKYFIWKENNGTSHYLYFKCSIK